MKCLFTGPLRLEDVHKSRQLQLMAFWGSEEAGFGLLEPVEEPVIKLVHC